MVAGLVAAEALESKLAVSSEVVCVNDATGGGGGTV